MTLASSVVRVAKIDLYCTARQAAINRLSVVALLVLLALVGCGQPSLGDYTVTQVPENVVTDYSDSRMPSSLTCSYIPAGREGVTWNGVTIGVTTFLEVGDAFSDVLEFREPYGHWFYTNPYPGGDGWILAQACYIDRIVVSMKILGDAGLPRAIDGLVAELGKPDIVTWARSVDERTLIWGERGILVVIALDDEESAGVIYFPPIEKSELENNWIVQSLPQEFPQYDVDYDYPYPGIEDPWRLTDD